MFLRVLLILTGLSLLCHGSDARLTLPTDNQYLFHGEPDKFYMFCHRNFEGKASRPWTAGKYGYVRNMRRRGGLVIGTRLHEGIDISSIKRDRRGEPQDIVRPIAPGTVVYVNASSGRSNYGKYVIVKHQLPGGEFHSLYAHFKRVDCQSGQQVTRTSPLGILGYTGRGTTRERAHLHLEFGILCSPNYDGYLREVYPSLNHHGNYNGLNFLGCDVSRLLTASHQLGGIDLGEQIRQEECYFKVTLPRKGPLHLLSRHPFLAQGDTTQSSPSWQISFTAAGFPLAVEASNREVKKPSISWVKPYDGNHADRTTSRLSGRGRSATLTARGQRHIRLLTEDFSDPS